jgi:hypothetical protein
VFGNISTFHLWTWLLKDIIYGNELSNLARLISNVINCSLKSIYYSYYTLHTTITVLYLWKAIQKHVVPTPLSWIRVRRRRLMRSNRLAWYGHVMRRIASHITKRAMGMNVDGHSSRGRYKKRVMSWDSCHLSHSPSRTVWKMTWESKEWVWRWRIIEENGGRKHVAPILLGGIGNDDDGIDYWWISLTINRLMYLPSSGY